MNDQTSESDVALLSLRDRIDEIDARIQALISERATVAREVGVAKGFMITSDFYRPEREAHVLREVVRRNNGPLGDDEMVVLKQFGHSVRALSLGTIAEVFHEVEGGVADFGVVPVENSTEGTVTHTLDMFLSSPLKICGEVELRIQQHLMGRMTNIRDIERICSHPQSLAQCRAWLAQSLPDVVTIPVSSNAAAARRARDETGTAAIAGDVASEVYDLNIVISNIEDQSDNTTRFLVVGRKLLKPSGDGKTSLLMSSSGTKGPGVLHSLLDPLARSAINMTRIESRPSRRQKWDYVFFVDIEGHAEDDGIRQALEQVGTHANLFRVLGSYPKAVL